MKITLRALLGVSALAFMFVASPVLASEVNVNADNTTTGAESKNKNETALNNGGDVDVVNSANVNNSAEASVNTGDNEQEKNTEAGDVTSGDVNVSADWDNAVNQGMGLCGCLDNGNDLTVSADFSNDTTGYKSYNKNELTVNTDGDQTFTNAANVLNALALSANTGNNEQKKNTTGGDMETGSIDLAAMFNNDVNSSDGIGGSSHGSSVSVDMTGTNHKTGAYSKNKNEVTVNNGGQVTVTNSANVTNSVALMADTGNNEQKKNTQAGDLKTGDVGLTADISNTINKTDCGCVAGQHETSVMVDASNDTTGADSKNKNEVTVNNDGDTTVTNAANVNNAVNADANTGGNEQEKNTEAGSIETGSVSVDLNISNSVN